MMNDTYIRKHFQIQGMETVEIDPNENCRIQQTLSMIPRSWNSVIDVGCGDGRVSNILIERGVDVIGIDWSTTSLRHSKSKKIVVDIRKPWPFKHTFDGVICSEVLEHLPIEHVRYVISNIKKNTCSGFVISVPACESLQVHTAICKSCGNHYHQWGHLHSFKNSMEVDLLIGQPSIESKFVPYQGITPSNQIDRLRRLMGYNPYSILMICPFCGTKPVGQTRLSSFKYPLFWILAKMEWLSGPFRPKTGWIISRYQL